MKIIIPPTKRIIRKTVDYQGIGGKEIIILRTMTAKEAGEVKNRNIANVNFWERRPDLRDLKMDDAIVHYGHIEKNGFYLGYFVADDELEPEDTKAEPEEKTKAQKKAEKYEREYGDPALKGFSEGDSILEYAYLNYKRLGELKQLYAKWAIGAFICSIALGTLNAFIDGQPLTVLQMTVLIVGYYFLGESNRTSDKRESMQYRILEPFKARKTTKEKEEALKRCAENIKDPLAETARKTCEEDS